MAGRGAAVGFDCSGPDLRCAAIPDNTYIGNIAGCAAYAKDCWITDYTANQALQVDHPQYYIQYLGQRLASGQRDRVDDPGVASPTEDEQNRDGKTVESIYHVLARSHDPDSGTGRSLVVLTTRLVVRPSTPPAPLQLRRVLWRELIRE